MDREEARELIREYVGRMPRPVTSIAPVNLHNPEVSLFPKKCCGKGLHESCCGLEGEPSGDATLD